MDAREVWFDEKMRKVMNSEELINRIVNDFKPLWQVEAITLSGASVNNRDELSDYDFYIYIDKEIPVKTRTKIAEKYSNHVEINNQFWETGDEWEIEFNGVIIDIMYRDKEWIKNDLERVLTDYRASLGYTTAIWFNILHSVILYDKHNWFKSIQEQAKIEYPEELRKNIVAKNHPILRETLSSYFVQIKKAVKREDFVSINHRITAFLASYFDILFAINRVPHPGEKRLVKRVRLYCQKIPKDFEKDLNRLSMIQFKKRLHEILNVINNLVDNLDELLKAEELI